EATIDALLPEWPLLPASRRLAVSTSCSHFVARQIALSPAHIRFGIRVLFAAFCIFAFVRLGLRPLCVVAREQRAEMLSVFALEQVPLLVALERVLSSMTALAFFDHPDVLAVIGREPLPVGNSSHAWGPMGSPLVIAGPANLTCDVLVVGTGAGGATVAATLANAGVDVLMVEEGPYVPAAEVPGLLSDALPLMWRGGGLMATLGGIPIATAEGRCVGGGTEINSAIFQRAPDEVIAGWADVNHLLEFSPQTLARFYDRSAAAVNASLTPGAPGPPTEILRRAGEAMGWKITALERGRRETSSQQHQVSGFATGAKQSMSATLIPDALDRGARLLPSCRINRLTIKGRRVTGAVATARDAQGRRQRVTLSASQVFLCAGTTQTPSILQRSGISKNVGRSFQVHPTIRVVATFPERVNAHRHDLPLVAITEFMPALRMGGSVFTLSSFALALAEDWRVRGRLMPDYAHSVMYYVMIRPDGVGRVRSVPGLAEPVLTY